MIHYSAVNQSKVPGAKAARKPRIAMVDVAKGIGILLIVLGHNTVFTDACKLLASALGAFRIPFFFFVSGVTFTIGVRTFATIALQRADAWLKPCAVVLTGIGIAKIAAGVATAEALILSLTYAAGFTFAWPPLWFLPHLWLVYMCATALLLYGKKLFATPLRKVLLLVAMAGVGHQLLQTFDSPRENPECSKELEFSWDLFDCGLPFNADLLFITLMFFLCGNFLALAIKNFRPNALATIATLIVFLSLRYLFPIPMDLNARIYENLLVSPLQAFSGIYIMLNICFWLSRSVILVAVLTYFSRISLFILIFHAPFLYAILKLMPRWVHTPWIVGVAAFVIPVAVSAIIYAVCSNIRYIKPFFFPVKTNKASLPG